MFFNETIDKENRIYLGISASATYPEADYSPDIDFPEYLFGKESLSAENESYSLLRNGFYNLGYDSANFGTAAWNPFGTFIKEGDTVVIKPNWVMHYNKKYKDNDNLECLVTHPSIVRVVIDYVLIALKNTGKVIVADAPMQGCDLEQLLFKAGYLELFKFYEEKGLEIEFKDLRENQVTTKMGVITGTKILNEKDESIIVDLRKLSSHFESSETINYKVSDYNVDRTNDYHHNDKHAYSINKVALLADVIINIPKPKCHRLAGITAAQKNLVGLVFDKSSLPHRKIGSIGEGGDEYKNKSLIKKQMSILEERKLKLTERSQAIPALFLQLFIAIFHYMTKIFSKDKFMIGSWYGNDTIWRTVADLNYIFRYADKKGNLCDLPQRKIINIADMIVAGQGNGPIGPDPKYLGIILIGEDSCFMDALCCKIMGFDVNKIPGLIESMKNRKTGCSGIKKIYSNLSEYNKLLYSDFVPESDWQFEPHESWKGHL